MSDPLAEWEQHAKDRQEGAYDPLIDYTSARWLLEAVAEIRRLREAQEWYEKRCTWYGDELDRRKADLSKPHLEAISWCCDEHRQKNANEWIAHRAMVRELALSLETFVVGHFMDYGHAADVLAHPLVQQAREAPHA